MNYSKCKTCEEYGWDNHKCTIRWKVGTEDEYKERETWYGELRDVYASDRQEAAEKFSERYDRESDDCFIIASHSPVNIVVISTDGSEPEEQWFSVEGRAVPEYTATEIERVEEVL
jgi:hypothetical protein